MYALTLVKDLIKIRIKWLQCFLMQVDERYDSLFRNKNDIKWRGYVM